MVSFIYEDKDGNSKRCRTGIRRGETEGQIRMSLGCDLTSVKGFVRHQGTKTRKGIHQRI